MIAFIIIMGVLFLTFFYAWHEIQGAHLRAEKEEKDQSDKKSSKANVIHVTTSDGERKPLDENRLRKVINEAVSDLEAIDQDSVLKEALHNLFDGIPESDVGSALVMATRVNIEKDPNYSMVRL